MICLWVHTFFSRMRKFWNEMSMPGVLYVLYHSVLLSYLLCFYASNGKCKNKHCIFPVIWFINLFPVTRSYINKSPMCFNPSENFWTRPSGRRVLCNPPRQSVSDKSFLEIASWVYANFARDDRQAWYLTGDGGLWWSKKLFWPWNLVTSLNEGVSKRKTHLYCSSNLSERFHSRIRHILQILHTFL